MFFVKVYVFASRAHLFLPGMRHPKMMRTMETRVGIDMHKRPTPEVHRFFFPLPNNWSMASPVILLTVRPPLAERTAGGPRAATSTAVTEGHGWLPTRGLRKASLPL